METIQNNGFIDLQALNETSVIYDAEINFCQKSLSLSLLKKETISKCLNEQEQRKLRY